MKTKLLTIIIFLCFTVQGFAQNNDMKARMEFEDAETAYQNQDYSKAVTHLESAEKLLGKPTGKTRYLLILALNKNLTQDYEYQDLEKLKKLSKHYLDNYTTDTEKYREIYDLSNSLNRDYPKNLEEYNQVKQQKEEQIRLAQQDRQMKAKQEAEELKKAQAYVLNFAKKYNYKPNLTTSEFATLSSENEKLLKKLKKKYGFAGDPWSSKNGPAYISIEDDKVIYFAYMLVSGNSIDSANEIFYDIQRNLAPQYYNYNKETATISINVPGVGLNQVYFKIFTNKLRIVFRRNQNDGEPAY